MAKITLEIHDTPTDSWTQAAIDWIVNNVDSLPQPLEKYANGEVSVIEVLDAMYDSGTFEWPFMTTKDLQAECQKAAAKGFWEETLYRAYALMMDGKEYYNTRYWAYNGNPVAITASWFRKIVQQAIKRLDK